jgi:hydroxymethylbilane synthase
MSKSLILGTRGSLLATTQAQWVADRLNSVEVKLEIVKTAGDDLSVSLMDPTLPGAFVNALRSALLSRKVDFIVHSLKDLPTKLHPDISLAAIPQREDARDVLVSLGNIEIDEIAMGSIIGTSSPRRMAAIKARNPSLVTLPIRGNVDSRIQKVRNGEYAGAVLAAAGLIRIGRSNEIAQYFDLQDIVPAPAQGALAVECRADNQAMIELLATIDDAPTRLTSIAERAVLEGLDAGCDIAVGAFASIESGSLRLLAELGESGGLKTQRVQESIELASLQDYEAARKLGLQVAHKFVR